MAQSHQVRIIGGKWRGRRLPIPALAGLRPTPDRIRETVFNWLQPVLNGASCLDAFAGTGVLGFEALSRGAAEVVMVDRSQDVVSLLLQAKQAFAATEANVYCADLPSGLRPHAKPFDVVFLDPPYLSHLVQPMCFYLEEHAFLAKEAYIYLEASALIKDNDLPLNWQLQKAKCAGTVFYHLAYRTE